MATKKKDPKTDAIVAAVGVDLPYLLNQRQQALGLVDFLRGVTVRSPAEEQWASEQRSNVGALHKVINDKRMSIKRPLLDAGRAVDDMFKPALAPLAEAEAMLLDLLKGAAQARLDAEAAVLALVAELAPTGDSGAVLAAVASMPEAVDTAGSSAGWRWEAEVVEFSAVPESFKLVDFDKLNELAMASKAVGEEPSVPGVVWHKRATVRRKA